jgi:hypothetical protein
MPELLQRNLPFLSVAASVLAVVFYLTYSSSVLSVSFDIDEADYMYSMEKGFAAHYFDRNALSFLSFVKTGLTKGLKNDRATELSKSIRYADDINIYRHFHGPLYFYYMMLGRKFVGNGERAIRSFSLVLQFICSIIALLGCFLLSGAPHARIPALFAALLVLFSPSLYFTVSLVSPHGMYVLLCLMTLFLLAKAIASKKESYFFLSAATVALAFVTLEYAFLLVICWMVSAGSVYLKDKSAFPHLWKFLFKSFCIHALVIVALWPAALLKLSLVKAYMFLAYFVLVRGHIYTSTPLLTFWRGRIAGSPVEYGIVALGVVLAVYVLWKKRNVTLIPFVTYLACIFLMEVKHVAPVPTYMSSLIAVGFVTAGMAVHELFQKKTPALTALLAALCILSFAFLRFSYLPGQQSPRLLLRTEMTEFLKKEMPERVLVARPMLSLVHYYFRAMTADSYVSETYSKDGQMSDLRAGLTARSDYDGVVYFGNHAGDVEALIAEYYACEPVEFTRQDWNEQWVYFRLQPKRPAAGQ